ncbi:MAG: nitrous oxide reductase accessory protein NosL [Campylobacter sp.]|nr:nitrous oxide reductase accessory protein NosL [Campylobacter sp.]
MKIVKFLLLSLMLAFMPLSATEFNKAASGEPVFMQDGDQKEFCPICGMPLNKHYKTTHAATLKNGKDRHYCSIRCLVYENEENPVDLTTVKTIDAKTEKIIDANSAFYVVGSKAPTTMTKVSKYAFENEDDAREFMGEFGGEIAKFEDVLALEESDFAKSKLKKQKEIYPKGRSFYEKNCTPLNPQNFENIKALRNKLKKTCKFSDEKELSAPALYLWEVVRMQMSINENDKCPVCGMFVAPHKQWASKIIYENNEYKVFDGVKDMMKFYLEPQKYGGDKNTKIKQIQVNDYYLLTITDAKTAFFVAGSDVLGPMGNELIPFKDEKNAKIFSLDHKGVKIYKFDEINVKLLCELDGKKCE